MNVFIWFKVHRQIYNITVTTQNSYRPKLCLLETTRTTGICVLFSSVLYVCLYNSVLGTYIQSKKRILRQNQIILQSIKTSVVSISHVKYKTCFKISLLFCKVLTLNINLILNRFPFLLISRPTLLKKVQNEFSCFPLLLNILFSELFIYHTPIALQFYFGLES